MLKKSRGGKIRSFFRMIGEKIGDAFIFVKDKVVGLGIWKTISDWVAGSKAGRVVAKYYAKVKAFFYPLSKKIRLFLARALVVKIRNSQGKKRLVKYREVFSLFLFPLLFLYSEVFLRIFNGTGLFRHLIYPILFGFALGFFLSIFVAVFSPKVNRIVTIVLMSITAFLYILEDLLHNSYQVYMNIKTVFAGAGGVATGFADSLFRAIFLGIPQMLIFLIPLIFYLIAGKKRIPARQYKPILILPLAIISLVLFFLGVLTASTGKTANMYKDQYNFNTAVATFGLPTGLRLDVMRGSSTGSFVQQTEEKKRKAVEGENSMDIDFTAEAEKTEEASIKNALEYAGSLNASNKNEYTGLFKGKNLILICAEAFSGTGVSEKLTPTLYRMMHKGIYFSNYYQPAWGGSTSSGEYSFTMGTAPTNGMYSITNTIGHNLYFTLGNQLQRQNYFSAAYHNGKYTFYDRNLTHTNLGYDSWTAKGNGLEEICGSSPDDIEMFSKTLDSYIDKQPFSIYYMTISGHAPYNEDSPYVNNEEEYKDYVKANIDRDYKDKTLNYLVYQMALEKALETMIEKLEEAGIADDTVICLTSDHYPYGLEKSDAWENSEDYLADLYGDDDTSSPWGRDRNGLLLWSGSLENDDADMACEISDPTYSLDIVPTLSNLFGLEYDSRLLVGRDVFSDEDPLVFWLDGSWMTDKGRYLATTGEFTPNEGKEADDDYVTNISAQVTNKIKFSDIVCKYDVYGTLFGKDAEAEESGETEESSE